MIGINNNIICAAEKRKKDKENAINTNKGTVEKTPIKDGIVVLYHDNDEDEEKEGEKWNLWKIRYLHDIMYCCFHFDIYQYL